MKVTLAYPYGKHKPDETIDVDDAKARLLVRDGLARLPEADAYDDMTVTELRSYAADNGIDLGGVKSKADITSVIRTQQSKAIPPQSPITPVTGTNEGVS